MTSEDSDDEPLSTIAATKRRDLSESLILSGTEADNECNIEIEDEESSVLQNSIEETAVIERPTDVWLYLKDFNSIGPYSCLLCSEWFLTKTKIIIHYVVNHQKDYCSICSYFVPNREAWSAHLKFHAPWTCLQCSECFMSRRDLSNHMNSMHKLIHCRLCNLRLPTEELYNTHLYRKHSVTKVSNKYADIFWDFEYEDSSKFICLLCTNGNIIKTPFSEHFLGFHRFNFKCFMLLISGTDLPISIQGVNLSQEFIEKQLKENGLYGYVELGTVPLETKESLPINNETAVIVECVPEIEEPVLNEDEKRMYEIAASYKGYEDFDVSLVELVFIQRFYYDHINDTLTYLNLNTMPPTSEIDYANNKIKDISCCFCSEQSGNASSFATHMSKMHIVKTLSAYTCRVCATLFTSLIELRNHVYAEMGEFEDLWLCQFCDKEFSNRNETRKHLTEHWNVLEYDNCFSPHLGFKCMFCPMLFWNETDREMHHVEVHLENHRSNFYKCSDCDELFSDKVWFIHHFIDKHNNEDTLYLLKCCICCVVLKGADQMRSHFNQHHPEARKIFCSLGSCKFKPFSNKKSFYLHIRSIHNPAKRIPRERWCDACALKFPNGHALAAHNIQAHGVGRFKCTLCAATLRTSDERTIHYLLTHPGQYFYKCTVCDKSFQYKSSLYMHKRDHAPNKKDHPCNLCGKVFIKKDSYREHMRIHQAPRFPCSYCPMKFVQRSNMIRHERLHTGERPYTCRWCPRTFADKGACNSHSRVHLKDKSFSCKYCGQKFVQKSKLNYHIRKHTGENLETCTICLKKYTSTSSLREHMKTHETNGNKRKKTFKCPFCQQPFPERRSLSRHMRSRHARSLETCPVCTRAVCSLAALREHVLTHAPNKMFRCRLCPKSYHGKRPMLRHLRINHAIKDAITNPAQYYHRLEPEECNLGLDEEVFNKIFNPSRTKITEVDVPESNCDETVNVNTVEHSMVQVKEEPDDSEEPQPTDFVKVECVNEQSD